jgi:hypothetical protein
VLSCAGALLALLAAGAALADPPPDHRKTKASSFAPRHTSSHVYGTPIGKPILHKHKKQAHAAAPAGADAPIK